MPQALGVGCNTGKVDTYQTINANELSNGAYTVQEAAASPLCFGTAFILAELPSITGLSLTGSLLSPVVSALNTVQSSLNCKAITNINQTALAVCPGFTLYGGPTGPVAPGSIQS